MDWSTVDPETLGRADALEHGLRARLAEVGDPIGILGISAEVEAAVGELLAVDSSRTEIVSELHDLARSEALGEFYRTESPSSEMAAWSSFADRLLRYLPGTATLERLTAEGRRAVVRASEEAVACCAGPLATVHLALGALACPSGPLADLFDSRGITPDHARKAAAQVEARAERADRGDAFTVETRQALLRSVVGAPAGGGAAGSGGGAGGPADILLAIATGPESAGSRTLAMLGIGRADLETVVSAEQEAAQERIAQQRRAEEDEEEDYSIGEWTPGVVVLLVLVGTAISARRLGTAYGPQAEITAFLVIGFLSLFSFWRFHNTIRSRMGRAAFWDSFRLFRRRPTGTGCELVDQSHAAARSTWATGVFWALGVGGTAVLLAAATYLSGPLWIVAGIAFAATAFVLATAFDSANSLLRPGRTRRSRFATVVRSSIAVNWRTFALLGTGATLLIGGLRQLVITSGDGSTSLLDAPITGGIDRVMAEAGHLATALAILAGAVLAFASRGVSRMTRAKLEQRKTDGEILDPETPTVVYLRSFRDDDVGIEGGVRTSTLVEALHWSTKIRFEEAAAAALAEAGDVHAIGEPGSHPHRLGAARAYYSDAAWQDAAQAMIQSAEVVALVAGRTGGLRWELHEVARSGALSKLLVYFPPANDESLASRWLSVQSALGLPDLVDLSLGRARPLVAYHSDKHGGPVVVVAATQNDAAYLGATRRAIQDLRQNAPAEARAPSSETAKGLLRAKHAPPGPVRAEPTVEVSGDTLTAFKEVFGVRGEDGQDAVLRGARKFLARGGNFPFFLSGTGDQRDSEALLAVSQKRGRLAQPSRGWRAELSKAAGEMVFSTAGNGALLGLALTRPATDSDLAAFPGRRHPESALVANWVAVHPALDPSSFAQELDDAIVVAALDRGYHALLTPGAAFGAPRHRILRNV